MHRHTCYSLRDIVALQIRVVYIVLHLAFDVGHVREWCICYLRCWCCRGATTLRARKHVHNHAANTKRNEHNRSDKAAMQTTLWRWLHHHHHRWRLEIWLLWWRVIHWLLLIRRWLIWLPGRLLPLLIGWLLHNDLHT